MPAQKSIEAATAKQVMFSPFAFGFTAGALYFFSYWPERAAGPIVSTLALFIGGGALIFAYRFALLGWPVARPRIPGELFISLGLSPVCFCWAAIGVYLFRDIRPAGEDGIYLALITVIYTLAAWASHSNWRIGAFNLVVPLLYIGAELRWHDTLLAAIGRPQWHPLYLLAGLGLIAVVHASLQGLLVFARARTTGVKAVSIVIGGAYLATLVLLVLTGDM